MATKVWDLIIRSAERARKKKWVAIAIGVGIGVIIAFIYDVSIAHVFG